VASDGTVVITSGDGMKREFQPDVRGGYFDQPGDFATFSPIAGADYLLQETDGLVTAFRPDGKIDYVQDVRATGSPPANTGGLLTSLAHSSGQSLQIAYNAAGRIHTITDPATGRTTTYTYDAAVAHHADRHDLRSADHRVHLQPRQRRGERPRPEVDSLPRRHARVLRLQHDPGPAQR